MDHSKLEHRTDT